MSYKVEILQKGQHVYTITCTHRDIVVYKIFNIWIHKFVLLNLQLCNCLSFCPSSICRFLVPPLVSSICRLLVTPLISSGDCFGIFWLLLLYLLVTPLVSSGYSFAIFNLTFLVTPLVAAKPQPFMVLLFWQKKRTIKGYGSALLL